MRLRPLRAVLAVLLTLASALLPAQPQPVTGVVLSNDAWPRATTLNEWTSDVIRISRLENASETAQAKAFFTGCACSPAWPSAG